MPRPRGGFTRRTSNPQYFWNTIGEALSGNNVPAKILGTAHIVSNAPNTLVRIRGTVAVSLDSGAVNEAFLIRAGIIKVMPDAFAAGAGSIPSPVDDPEAEWLWHSYFPLRALATGNDSLSGGGVQRTEIDSKAMRRVKTNERLVFMVDATILSGSPTMDFTYGFRTLLAA